MSCCNKSCVEKRSVPLKFSCPPGCACQNSEIRNWQHLSCMTPNIINEMGDIYCQQHKDKKGCSPYFIKDAKFQCAEAKKSNSWYQYNNPADFLMAIAQSMKAAQFALSDQNLNEFTKNLTLQVTMKWYA